MKKRTMLIIFIILFVANFSFSQSYRHEIKIPNVDKFFTLKCDFHMHSVFSDGSVWPTVRVQEAWRQGLDAIALTDHLEYHPFKDDVSTDPNRSYQIAKSMADRLGLILIHGTEITRSMPPGHFNALFIKDAAKINKENWRDAIVEANNQGAFVFWNHPGWKSQAPDGAKWYAEHTDLFQNKLFQGIEIVNQYSYYPEVFQWAIDKNLTILGNSDSHDPIDYEFNPAQGKHRPMTLVFAIKKSEKAIHEALLDGRTAVYFEDKIFSREIFLIDLFFSSIDVVTKELKMKPESRAYIKIRNKSDLIFYLKSIDNSVSISDEITLLPNAVALFSCRAGKEKTNIVHLRFAVNNLLIAPDKSLEVEIPISIVIE